MDDPAILSPADGGNSRPTKRWGVFCFPSLLMNAFLKRSGIEPFSFASRILTPPEREALIKKAAVIFDVNPIVVRIRLDSLFP